MISQEIYAAASRHGVSVTIPEPQCDIDAQISALLDPEHPKNCVFLCRGQPSLNWTIPHWIFVEERPEGTLLTDSAYVAAAFRNAEWMNDEMLAAFLRYPEAKPDLVGREDIFVAQALDKNGNVVWEAGCSTTGLEEAMMQAHLQVPRNGCAHCTTVGDAMARRLRLNGKSN